MHTEHHRWYSPRLGRTMNLAVFGHWGRPVVVFPTSNGHAWEYRDKGLVGALGGLIGEGRCKLFCLDGNFDESFFNSGAHHAHRSWRQHLYDQYVVEEVVPFIHAHCRSAPPLIAFGASLGGYYAVNTVGKHPDLFRHALALSGVYDMRPFFGWTTDETFYFNNPVDYLAQMPDGPLLEQLRRCSFRLVTGTGPHEDASEAYRLGAVLSAQGIPHAVENWGPDGGHDWPYWYAQAREYLGQVL